MPVSINTEESQKKLFRVRDGKKKMLKNIRSSENSEGSVIQAKNFAFDQRSPSPVQGSRRGGMITLKEHSMSHAQNSLQF